MVIYDGIKDKIYSDYSMKSEDELLIILENKVNYLNEIIEVVRDILIEKELNRCSFTDENEKTLIDIFNTYTRNNDSIRAIISNQSDEKLMEIVLLQKETNFSKIILATIIAVEKEILTNSQGQCLVKMLNMKENLIDIYKAYKPSNYSNHAFFYNKTDEEILEIVLLKKEYNVQIVLLTTLIAIEKGLLKKSQGYGIIKILNEKIDETLVEIKSETKRSIQIIPLGIILFIIGAVLTVISFANSTNGEFILFPGLIMVGLIIVFSGLKSIKIWLKNYKI